jgi:hypothetical protein
MRLHRDADCWIASWESLSSYLHRFSMAQDKAETAGNEFSNDALVDLFLSILGMDNTAYYSILRTTLENQHGDGQNISFVDLGIEIYPARGMTHLQCFQSS